ncbi:PqqD family protein [Merismopedia glauca]|uniref:Pyrroloquinoline quinone biosynthesis protein PqqD n=1 Tax=Merismopedia glauca CCAP 1448/3 TaxID=1296344 RepID=A0A2T1C3N7_9CYAN|nr:PqqD family protein [Merismopedia glauca]PSB02892.1 pyrroloquinoline quinone biosynthesis protein PqqD [Merismopedia glauca CCAP 1448/3]
MSPTFRINSPKVVHETIEGEVVVVNLDRGDYYSLAKVGADIWDGIARGISQDNLITEISHRYDGSYEEIKASIDIFIEKLQLEKLIVLESANTAAIANNGTQETPSNTIKDKAKFEPPTLEKFTDMQDLLLLDPIHEVEETGWPNAKQ